MSGSSDVSISRLFCRGRIFVYSPVGAFSFLIAVWS